MRIKTVLFVCLFNITCANELIASQYTRNTTLHLANTFHNRAEQWYFENFDSCAFYLEKALPLFKKIKKWDAYVDCINGLFAVSYQKRDFAKAEKLAYKANKEAYKYLENRSEVYNSAINSLGAIYYEKRFIKKAISNYEVALYNEFSKSKRNNALIASLHHNISNAQITIGDYEAALQNLFQAAYLREKLHTPDVFEIAQTYKSIGFCLRKMQKFSEASKFYHKSFFFYNNIQKEGGDYLLNEKFNVLQSLAKVYFDNNNLDSCNYVLNKLRTSFLSNDKIKSKSSCYETFGHLHLKLEKKRLAEGFYKKAIDQAIIEHQEFEYHPNIARSISNLGNFYLEMKDYKKAIFYYQQALTKLVFGFQPDFLHQNPSTKTFLSTIEGIKILHGKAKALFLYHKQTPSARVLNAALKTYQVADSLISRTRGNIFSTSSKQQLTEQLNVIYEDAIHTALGMYQLTEEVHYLAIAFSFAESNKAILLLESIQEGLARNFGGLPQKLQEKERSIRMNIAFYEQLINEQKQKGLEADYQKITSWTKQLFQLNKAYHKLDHILESKYSEYKKLKHSKVLVSIQDIQQKLQANDALFEYFWGETAIFLFSITKNNVDILRIPKSADMDKVIRQLTDYLQHRNQRSIPSHFTELAFQCFSFFIKPVIDKLPTSVNRLIIIPDGLLAYIPFEILISKRVTQVKKHLNWSKLDYLLKKFAITYSYSSTLFLNSLKTRKHQYKHTFLGLAPSFQPSIQFREVRNCASNQLYALHCAGKEVLAIKDLLGGKAILKESAKLEQFKIIASDFQVLHLATHACSNHQNPKFSKIYFAQEALATNDLSTLYLPSELAVLSACNTGSGKLIKGEGVMSLSTGFISAGCPSTVMSLWSLDDCATLDLMLLFYSYLKKGLAKDQALRKAKLDFIANSDKVHQQPYYWAAFVQMGNYRPLELNKISSKKMRLLFIFFIMLSIPLGHLIIRMFK